MTNAQLEHVVMVQARELEAQRRDIARYMQRVRELESKISHQRTEYRRGYQTGWSAARRSLVA